MAGLASFALALPAPAGAFFRDFGAFLSQTSISSDPVRTVVSDCPGGSMLLGTGASAFSSGSGVSIPGVGLRQMWPVPVGGGSRAEISAVEANPVAASWGLLAQRHCATLTNTAPTAATNGSYIKDVFVASTTSAFNSTSPKAVSTACQGGRQSIGGGFYVRGTSGVLRKTAVRRAVRVEGGFAVEAHETIPHGTSWAATAFAVCANLGNVGDRQATYAGTNSGNTAYSVLNIDSPYRSVGVNCPSGYTALGGGAELQGATATTPPPGDVVLMASYPLRTSAGVTTWVAQAVEETETNRNWRLGVRVICAQPVVR